MSSSYDATQRRTLEAALRAHEPLQCPVCHVALTSHTVAAPAEVSYVRHRVFVICPQCKRSAGLEQR
jgi:uncharacterized protein with PIN domain